MGNPKKGEQNNLHTLESSSWIFGLKESLRLAENGRKFRKLKLNEISLKFFSDYNNLWILYTFKSGNSVVIRACYDPAGIISTKVKKENGTFVFTVNGTTGVFTVKLDSFSGSRVLRCTTSLKHRGRLRIPWVPRDICAVDDKNNPLGSKGKIHTVQHGPCSGIVYFSFTGALPGSALYFQNFTALNMYFEQTRTTPGDTVGGHWPEMGMKLPSCEDNPVKSRLITLSDIFINFSDESPAGSAQAAHLYLQLLGGIYLHLPKPKVQYFDWPKAAQKTIKILTASKQCRRLINNNFYLNAYVDSDDKPPESMVQLSVLVPMLEYVDWRKTDAKIVHRLRHSLGNFYSEKLKTFVRWLPGVSFKKDRLSEEEQHGKMDSWYHLHILLNLGRLVNKGDNNIRKMFFNSVDYTIKAARKFRYKWPVFYDMNTLRVIKDETSEGMGGELDVPGIYAHVMLQAYEFTKENKYLKEAELAARYLKGLEFHLVYQTNITLFSSIALARLWSITKNRKYLELSILCAANVINRLWIWNCKYGYAKKYDTFMGMLPLHDAKYLALYEESESMAAISKLVTLLGNDAPEGLKAITADYIKYLLHRGKFYYPQNLPEEALKEEPKSGKLNKKLAIPVEDLQQGWEQSAQVGQEVYGAAAPFIFVSCAYTKPDGLPFAVYCSFPLLNVQFEVKTEGGEMTFMTGGVKKQKCTIRIIHPERHIKNILIYSPETGKPVPKSGKDYIVTGNTDIRIRWKRKKY